MLESLIAHQKVDVFGCPDVAVGPYGQPANQCMSDA